jgi:hypothetical protein
MLIENKIQNIRFQYAAALGRMALSIVALSIIIK